MLQAAVQLGVRRVVMAPSAAVYGEPRQLPVKEDHPLCPMSPYGLSKMAVEAYTRWFGEKYGIEWVVLRYGNVYGPRQRAVGEAGVVARFLAAMQNGYRPVIFWRWETDMGFRACIRCGVGEPLCVDPGHGRDL